MKKWKKILIVLVIGALIASAFMPMNSTADLSTAPEITVKDFMLSGIMSVTGEYANETQLITVEVENTGKEYLTDIEVTCEIYSDAGLTTMVADLGTNGTTSMDPDEVMSFGFDTLWTPNVLAEGAAPTSFWVNITATGIGFEDKPDTYTYPATEVVIQNMTVIEWVPNIMFDTMGVIMTPYPYVEEMMPGVETYNYSSAVNTPQLNVVNKGNVEATNVVVDVDGYEDIATDWDSDYNSQYTVTSLLPGATSDWTDFPDTWDLSAVGDGQLNLTVSSGADVMPANTTHYFMVQDLEDIRPMMLTTDLKEMYGGVTTFNTTALHTFMVLVVNSGNQDISTDFYARLNATEWSPSSFGAESDYGVQLIDAGTTTLNPGDPSPEIWPGIAPPGTGFYQFNVTAPGLDGTVITDANTTNNETNLVLNFEDTEGLSLVLTSPSKDSKWPVMDMDINATVTNTGTLDFADLGGGQVSLMIYNNNDTIADTSDDVEVWTPANVTIPGLVMTMDTWADWTWTGAVGGEEYLVVVNATIGTTTVGQAVTITFPHPNGTVSGMITPDQAGIEVKAWDGTTEISMTTTEATGFYQMSLEAIVTAYNITVTAPYGYYDAHNDTVMIKDDKRPTNVNFDLIEIPGGDVNGTVTLVEGGMGDTGLDYTNIVVAVDGTPLFDDADDVGNYSVMDIVPGTVNVTAFMANFGSAWNDSVVVVVGEVTEDVNFTLYEDWDVVVTPAHEEGEVLIDATVTVTFEEEINITSVNLTNTFDVTDSTDASVAGVIAWADDNMSFVFTPDAVLEYAEKYTIWIISIDVTNLTDVAVLHRDWFSTFDTEEIVILNGTVSGWVVDAWNGDLIAGANVSVGPVSTTSDTEGKYMLSLAAGAVTVGASKALYVSDSADATVVAGLDTPEVNLSLTPDVNIDASVMVDGTSTDLTPGTRTMDVDVDTAIAIDFKEAINETSLVVTLADGGAVTGTTELNTTTNIATFTPDAALTAETNYTVTITDALTNATGDAMLARDIDWMFMTGMGVPETVTATISPADGATDVALAAVVTITFDYAMNATVTEAAITAAFGTDFTWSADGMTVTIVHADFAQDTDYTVSITGAGESAEGYLTEAATSTFTTIPPPTYTYDLGTVNDADGAVSGATVTVKDSSGTTVWTGTTDANGQISFTQATPLPEGDYTVKVSKSGYKDISYGFTVGPNGDKTGQDAVPTMKKDKDEPEDDNMLAIILIIIVIIIIVVLLALAMRPKKAAEEELEEEEAEAEEGAEDEEFECPECGAAVSSGETVCPECGAEFEEEEFECPECGAKLETGAGTCPECGAEFEAEEEETEEGEEGEEEELEDYEVEEEEFEEEELGEDEEMEEEMEEEEGLEGEEELPEEEEAIPEEEEAPAEEEEAPAEEEEEKAED